MFGQNQTMMKRLRLWGKEKKNLQKTYSKF